MSNFGDSLAEQFRGLNGRHPGQWPILPRLLCAVGALAVIVGLGWYSYWSKQLEELDLGKQDEVKLMGEYKNKMQQAVNLEGLRKQKEQVGEYVATLEKQLPSKAEMDALLSDINQAGLGRGLQFELFKPQQSIPKDYYAEQPIDVKVTGNYHDIAAFTSDVAGLPRIVTLNSMNLVTGKDGVLTLDAVAKTFRYLDPEEQVNQKKAKEAQNAQKTGGAKK